MQMIPKTTMKAKLIVQSPSSECSIQRNMESKSSSTLEKTQVHIGIDHRGAPHLEIVFSSLGHGCGIGRLPTIRIELLLQR